MFKSPESVGGNHESDRAASRANGKKVLSAAEAAKQKEIEDRLRRMMQVQKAKQAAENNHEATSNATPSSAETLSPTAEQTAQKAKGNSAFKRALVGILLGGGVALSAFAAYQAGKQSAQTPVATEAVANDADTMNNAESQEEANPFAGELSNGVSYDYYEYADIENKTSKNAYGYDKSDAFGNREATENAWMDMASKGPEYLASYATHVFTDEEKQSLGIAGMSPTQLDDYMSNAENIDGGEKQRNIMAALDAIARDQENTVYEFYHEEGEENTYYISFEDLNNDGNYSPDELKLGYTTKKRNGAPQVDIYRIINGEKVKVLDLNMECGMQPNDEQPPQDLPPIPPDDDDSAGNETSGTEPSGSEPTPSGSEPTRTPEEPTAGSESAGNETTDVKDPAAEIRNARDHVDQQQLNQDVTPATNVNQDQANHQAIEQQKQQDAAAAAAAEQQRQQQAAAEQAAAQAAEQRRQEQAAAEAAAAAEAQAAAERAAAQAAEQQRQQQAAAQAAAAEKAAREQAQREADARAAAAAATAASNTGDTAEQRANDFANGNF